MPGFLIRRAEELHLAMVTNKQAAPVIHNEPSEALI
jgi:hypothetical protein